MASIQRRCGRGHASQHMCSVSFAGCTRQGHSLGIMKHVTLPLSQHHQLYSKRSPNNQPTRESDRCSLLIYYTRVCERNLSRSRSLQLGFETAQTSPPDPLNITGTCRFLTIRIGLQDKDITRDTENYAVTGDNAVLVLLYLHHASGGAKSSIKSMTYVKQQDQASDPSR